MEANRKLAGEVVQSFMTISRTLTRFTQQNAASIGLTLPQMGIMNTIYAAAGITLKEITERLQLPKSTVSVAVDDLVNKGLIDRKGAEDDRREINLKTTPEGETLAKKSCENASSYRAMEYALGKMGEEDKQALLCMHKELMDYMQEYANSTFS